jgi:hypothetical protein
MSNDTTPLPPGYGTALQVANWNRAFNADWRTGEAAYLACPHPRAKAGW